MTGAVRMGRPEKKDIIKVSVIIPVYNPGRGIVRCIRFLRGQLLREIELIFVDDCGSDRAMEIVRKAAARDSRIRILKNERNLGAGPSRNRGLAAAAGEYVAFADPDDYMARDFLSLLYAKAEKTGADIVKGERLQVSRSGRRVRDQGGWPLNAFIRRGLARGRPLYTLFTYNHWTAVYRREFLLASGAQYGLSRNAQDSTFLLRACFAAESIAFEDRARYCYVSREGSRMKDFTPARLANELQSFREQAGFLLSREMDGKVRCRCLCAGVAHLMRIHEAVAERSGFPEERALFVRELREYVRELPCCEEMISTSFPVRALMLHGACLITLPFGDIWEEVPYAEYRNAVGKLADYVTAHREECAAAAYFVREAFEQALSYREQDRAREAELRRLFRALPDRRFFEKRCGTGLRLLSGYGVNVFPPGRKLRKIWLHLLYPRIR